MKYRFRPLPELYWGIITAALLAVLPTFLTFDPSAVQDWRTWALAIAGAAVRPAAGSIIDYIRRSMSPQTATDEIIDLFDGLHAEERVELFRELDRRSQGATRG